MTVRLGCGYVYLSWMITNNKISCKIREFVIMATYPNVEVTMDTQDTFYNITHNLPSDTVYNISVYGHNKGIITDDPITGAVTTVATTSVRTVTTRGTYSTYIYNTTLCVVMSSVTR